MPTRQRKMLMKSTWFPQPHVIRGGCSFELDDETINSTIVPIAFYDEGLGAPTSKETNPRNASFAVLADEANCFVGSRINMINAEFRVSITSKVLDDNIPAIRYAMMPIFMAFKENYTAIDELSSAEIQDVLELQTESTDRQGGALYVAGADVAEKASNRALVGLNTPFLDTDTGLEGVAFDPNGYYDMIHFKTNGQMLAKSTGGLRWSTVSPNFPVKRHRYAIHPKVKRMNEFTYYGMLLHFPIGGNQEQYESLANLTVATAYIHVDWNIRYNEWNEDFNSRML